MMPKPRHSAGENWWWHDAMLSHGVPAILDAQKAFAANPDPGGLGANRLSAFAELIANAFKRRVLLEYLMFHAWNLTRVSAELGLGGAGSVTRLIRELGLVDEFRASGRRAGRPSKKPKPRSPRTTKGRPR